MKTKIFSVAVITCAVVMGLVLIFVYRLSSSPQKDSVIREQIVELNDLKHRAAQAIKEENPQAYSEIELKISEIQNVLRQADITQKHDETILLMFVLGGIVSLSAFGLSAYFYFALLRPFEKLKEFTAQISQGNFDLPLKYERSNYFGAFTWAFDNMRSEIKKARECEKEAIDNNKTVIATLSHDIKTPIASIRAYAEGLEAHLDSSPEKRMKYLSVIIRKCDEVTKLTNDLFLHSISDLDKLKVHLEPLELSSFLKGQVEELSAENGTVRLILPLPTAWILSDKDRMVQILGNLLNNARKYAKSPVDIRLEVKDSDVLLSVRDYGPGISDEDMPFIMDKFYRGRNVGNEQGSGLGLSIVKYIMDQQNGEISFINHENGLEVILTLPLMKQPSFLIKKENLLSS